jgi:hypothetical protein
MTSTTLWCWYWQGRELTGLKRQVAGLAIDTWPRSLSHRVYHGGHRA